MERKIGEIFEYNGEWYQCIEDTERISCINCCFYNGGCKLCTDESIGVCISEYRSDKKSICFKKLEKVGETYEKRVSDGTFSTFQRYKVCNPVILPKKPYMYYNFIDSTIEIEIKQTKEDMEEKKQCGDNRFKAIARAKEYLFQATNIAEDKKELEVLDSFLLRCWQMGWLKQYEDAEDKKLNLKVFDLQQAKDGKPVCTRDGRKARIICFDRINAKPILALVPSTDGKGEDVFDYFVSGKRMANALESDLDLIMLPEKKEGWINVYKMKESTFGYITSYFDTEENAKEEKEQLTGYVATVKINWEE